MLGIDENVPNKEEAIEEHRIKCLKYFDFIINSPTDVDFANFVNILFGNIAVCVNIKPLSWYFYKNQLWNDDNKESYRSLIDEEIYPICMTYIHILSKLKEKYDDDELFAQLFKKLFIRINEVSNKLKKQVIEIIFVLN